MKTAKYIGMAAVAGLVLWLAGCGGGGGGGSQMAIAPPSGGSIASGRTYGWATETTRPPADPNYVGIPSRQTGRMAAALLPGTLEIPVQPGTKGMSFQSQCAADFYGIDGTRRQDIMLAMAATFCWKSDGLVQFDLTTVSAIPADKILLAELRLYQYDQYGDFGDTWKYNFEVAAYPNTTAWDEATAWYYKQPAYATNVADNRIVITGDPGWRSWDVTDIVKSWQNKTRVNYGLRLETLNSGAPYDSTAFFYDEVSGAAQNPSLAPMLVLYVVDDAVTTHFFTDSDLDGVPNESDACPYVGSIPMTDVDQNGCPDTAVELYNIILADELKLRLEIHLSGEALDIVNASNAGDVKTAKRLLNHMKDEIARRAGTKIPANVAGFLLDYIGSLLIQLGP